MRNVFESLTTRQKADSSVFIHGERGSGRRFVARELHACSGRGSGPFVAHDCRIEGPVASRRKLFGEVREIAPGHFLKYLGLLEEVREGTLYLERIEDLPRESQNDLAGVLESGRFCSLGSQQSQPFRGRLVVSSSENLEDRVRDGSFDSHLFEVIGRDGVRLEVRRDGRPRTV